MKPADGRAPALEASDLDTDNLRSCINDLVGVLSLRALWSGADPDRISEVLADSLMAILEPEFIYVRPAANGLPSSHEAFKVRSDGDPRIGINDVFTMLELWNADTHLFSARIARQTIAGEAMTIVAQHLGVSADFGVLLIGSRRSGFPSATERLLITVAASQALVGLQEYARLAEQRDRATELDRVVSQRTLELAIANKMLRRSEALLNEGQRLSLAGSLAWNPGKNEFVSSEQMRRLFGLDVGEELYPDAIYRRVHADDLEAFKELVARAKTVALPDSDHEFRVVRPDGKVRHLHLVWRAVRSAPGDIEYLTAIQDVTERKLAEASARANELRMSELRNELAHANRLATVGQLSAAISHDVRQPLTSVMLSGQTALNWLGGDPPNVASAQGALERVLAGAERATQILDRTKSFAKKSAARRETIDLSEIVGDTIALVSADARHRGVALSTQLEGTHKLVGDRVQIQQVLMNLVVNAIDAVGASDLTPKSVTVATWDEDSAAISLEVRDTGPGIAEAQRGRLFEAFFTTKQDGMGMGLAICRDIVEAHGGQLTMIPTDPHGATFHLMLPLSFESEETDAPQRSDRTD